MLGGLIAAGSSLLGGILGGKSAEKNAKRNIATQKEFAQHGVRWKVEDAKRAGIHPLYALGAQTPSFSPVSGGDPFSGLASAGQDLSRSIDSTRTGREKIDAYSKTVQKLSLQRMGLENELLSAQIARVRQAGNPPAMAGADPMLIEGQGNALISNQPLERVSSAPGAPHAEAGAVTDVGYTKTDAGGYAPVYSQDAKQRLEDDTLGMIAWNLRNRVLPTIVPGYGTPPPNVPLKEGHYWVYNPFRQEYEQRRGRYGLTW